MSDADDIVLCERRGATSVITFNEPARLNPLSEEMRIRARDLLQQEMDNTETRVVVITGAGGNFSAGADVRQFRGAANPDLARSRRRLGLFHALARSIAAGPKPVIAAVEGVAYGAGLSLAVASDFLIAAENARFGAAFAKIGLAADSGLLWSLPQRIGLARTKDLLFTGRQVSGREAHEIGIVNMLVEPGRALEAALVKAEDYLASAPLSIAQIKFALAQMPTDLEAALAIEMHQQPLLSMTADHAEARAAFLEKRVPKFVNR